MCMYIYAYMHVHIIYIIYVINISTSYIYIIIYITSHYIDILWLTPSSVPQSADIPFSKAEEFQLPEEYLEAIDPA